MPKISACIVAYCDYDEVCAAVRSALANTPGDDFTLYVVDNASPDGSGKKLEQAVADGLLAGAGRTSCGDIHIICLLYTSPSPRD